MGHKQYWTNEHLEYPELTMYQMVEAAAKANPNAAAIEFYNKKTSYRIFLDKINQAARALWRAGIREGDRVTICLPNIPQAMVCFYALNRISAIANMVHPLSARDEISFYLNFSKSKMILTADMFYEKVEESLKQVDHPVTIILARMQDELPFPLNVAYVAKEGKKYRHIPKVPHVITWNEFMSNGLNIGMMNKLPEPSFDRNRTAVILYSGGTSGTPKGICLSDLNMNALAMQGKEATGVAFHPGITMLSCMPCFHGFGLGINLHLVFIFGGTCILMPTFNKQSYAKMLIRKRPNFIAGVPTIFEALLHIPELDKIKLDFLMGMFCGGDSLTIELKKKLDTFLKEHGASIQVREGYGLTECVTASCLTPKDTYRPGSIGVAFPDTTYAIVAPGTDEVMPYGEEGEIILTGPTVMLGYLDNPEETAKTLRKLSDGRTWLYTGDLGFMDEDGYVYFKQRIKRMIVTNGYNVYPGQLENAIDSCEEVAYSCVIGVKDPRRMHRVKAYIVLKDGVEESDAVREKIMGVLKTKIAAYALPREIVFRKELPRTLVGKVAYRKLEEESEQENAAKQGE
ncbi:MAG: class I adenylate-forming enzyme family protein [Eubacteriales bacterium]|nr:class I adenylate-forming enzyme family protein [Eubacteriales bacterium]